MLSDLALSPTTFAGAPLRVAQATPAAYYLAQGLIAFFVLPRGSSDE
ncbi:hypothetical protein [Roseiarcus sp.]